MQKRDLKYLWAYTIPIITILSIYLGSWWSFLTVLVTFIVLPILELLMPVNKANLSPDEIKAKVNHPFFDFILYLNLFWVYGILIYFSIKVNSYPFETYELLGWVMSFGILLSSCGINVAHELGHKPGKFAQITSKLLLLPNMYIHFIIEHNRGHHLNVGTSQDPATSRLYENVYRFWMRSIIDSYKSAWNIEIKDLQKRNIQKWSFQNQMIQFALFQLIYLFSMGIVFSFFVSIMLILSGLIGIVLLETINYIEHYGLKRELLTNGKYERVEKFHSWNSDHEVGRILLYELTRHSDHHYKANKKYQILNHFDESPQLPYGYPTSILIALIPPLWFQIMNPLVLKLQNITIDKSKIDQADTIDFKSAS